MGKTRINILIVDDEPIVSKRLKPSLERKGYDVETFVRAVDALDRFKNCPFDIVITDLKMEEELDGMKFLAEVKSLRPETEVIVITGFATMETAKESFKKGVLDFLAKPFKLKEIHNAVAKAVDKIKSRTE